MNLFEHGNTHNLCKKMSFGEFLHQALQLRIYILLSTWCGFYFFNVKKFCWNYCNAHWNLNRKSIFSYLCLLPSLLHCAFQSLSSFACAIYNNVPFLPPSPLRQNSLGVYKTTDNTSRVALCQLIPRGMRPLPILSNKLWQVTWIHTRACM
jgi:hypothetical protein